MFDVIVVGSGASGVSVSVPLADAGLSVLMLDVGHGPDRASPTPPAGSFARVRRTDQNQHLYFLGRSFEGIGFGGVGVGAQLTPERKFITKDAAKYIPIKSRTYAPLLSLAVGGLAAGWGGACFCFSDHDFGDIPIKLADIHSHYVRVAERIGVSGDEGKGVDAGAPIPLLPPYRLDTGSNLLRERYLKRRAYHNKRGRHLGRVPLALCTRAHRGRGPNPYYDMDFWADWGRAIYRPQWTLDELQRAPNFSYARGRVVKMFRELGREHVRISALPIGGGTGESFDCRKLVIATGVHASAILIMRSLGAYNIPRRITCNPYRYIVFLNTNAIGQRQKNSRHSLAQLSAVCGRDHADGREVQGQY